MSHYLYYILDKFIQIIPTVKVIGCTVYSWVKGSLLRWVRMSHWYDWMTWTAVTVRVCFWAKDKDEDDDREIDTDVLWEYMIWRCRSGLKDITLSHQCNTIYSIRQSFIFDAKSSTIIFRIHNEILFKINHFLRYVFHKSPIVEKTTGKLLVFKTHESMDEIRYCGKP